MGFDSFSDAVLLALARRKHLCPTDPATTGWALLHPLTSSDPGKITLVTIFCSVPTQTVALRFRAVLSCARAVPIRGKRCTNALQSVFESTPRACLISRQTPGLPARPSPFLGTKKSAARGLPLAATGPDCDRIALCMKHRSCYSILGIAVDRKHARKWLFPQEKVTLRCTRKGHTNS